MSLRQIFIITDNLEKSKLLYAESFGHRVLSEEMHLESSKWNMLLGFPKDISLRMIRLKAEETETELVLVSSGQTSTAPMRTRANLHAPGFQMISYACTDVQEHVKRFVHSEVDFLSPPIPLNFGSQNCSEVILFTSDGVGHGVHQKHERPFDRTSYSRIVEFLLITNNRAKFASFVVEGLGFKKISSVTLAAGALDEFMALRPGTEPAFDLYLEPNGVSPDLRASTADIKPPFSPFFTVIEFKGYEMAPVSRIAPSGMAAAGIWAATVGCKNLKTQLEQSLGAGAKQVSPVMPINDRSVVSIEFEGVLFILQEEQ